MPGLLRLLGRPGVLRVALRRVTIGERPSRVAVIWRGALAAPPPLQLRVGRVCRGKALRPQLVVVVLLLRVLSVLLLLLPEQVVGHDRRGGHHVLRALRLAPLQLLPLLLQVPKAVPQRGQRGGERSSVAPRRQRQRARRRRRRAARPRRGGRPSRARRARALALGDIGGKDGVVCPIGGACRQQRPRLRLTGAQAAFDSVAQAARGIARSGWGSCAYMCACSALSSRCKPL